ncbi:DNA polymerase IV [Ameyamaea chiangmaiensis NBRC 103196]|uniref:DNA polymerase IV n=1 Tax=Ameyamaea chiangmaiensis TaxID=442969 RepID=A0A850PD42_9PROT|nr:DNA polymerase IV [Ameyamaea chiangmaiensis]MBS4075271.1 DNA polymerase IV [Ameyamaea chiangmaiensis]NVN40420.1 DNA polymerase IV [Ameyamaea chiangmaiensis]GBQ66610.1 DNA polymerase IV [Ameyamaea chiangmaiensis NBRC 103196]
MSEGHEPDARRIIHVDMDAFYASVEQRDDPSLRGRPLAVGGTRARGVVAAASYEARRFGVRSAMPASIARRKCPALIFVPPRFDAYRAVSRQIHAIFARYTPLIQPLSLDEATLDVTRPLVDLGSATAIAQDIRAAILRETALTASAGVSYNRFLAKLASDQRKPDGLFVIPPHLGPRFVETLPVEAFHGIGPATARRMQALGLMTGLDLRRQTLAFLVHHFGKAGQFYYDIARGRDDRPVVVDRPRKSLGSETTFERDLMTVPEMDQVLVALCAKVWDQAQARGLRARGVTVKVRYSNFRSVTRSRSGERPWTGEADLRDTALALLRTALPDGQGVRLLGVALSGLGQDAADTADQMRLL